MNFDDRNRISQKVLHNGSQSILPNPGDVVAPVGRFVFACVTPIANGALR